MIPVFPKSISEKGIVIYVLCLILMSVAFFSHAMSFMWMVLGIIEVSIFFGLSSKFTKEWQHRPQKDFANSLFWTAVLIRVVWVVFSYFFYQIKTGQPFEFESADAIGYHEEASWLSTESWKNVWDYLFTSRSGYSDSGYALYLTTLYKCIGPNIMVTRLLKTFYSAFTCVLLYKLSSRTINEQVGRMAGIFAVLMPNLIIYCGLHVKETEMLLLAVAFLERTDYVLRSPKVKFWNILIPLLLAGVMFLFRTVLGVVALFSFATALVFSPNRVLKKGRRVTVAVWVIVAIIVLAGGAIMNEVEELWLNRNANQELKRMEQTSRGNQWAKYATGTVMAPMIFVMPFSTMVDVDNQYNQQILHGGNFVRNFMGFFVILALIFTLFINRDWKNMSLVGSYVIGYLGVISMSGFANSERFLLPALHGLIILWAYGLRCLSRKSFRYMSYWIWVVFLMQVAWDYFKLGSRGLF